MSLESGRFESREGGVPEEKIMKMQAATLGYLFNDDDKAIESWVGDDGHCVLLRQTVTEYLKTHEDIDGVEEVASLIRNQYPDLEQLH